MPYLSTLDTAPVFRSLLSQRFGRKRTRGSRRRVPTRFKESDSSFWSRRKSARLRRPSCPSTAFLRLERRKRLRGPCRRRLRVGPQSVEVRQLLVPAVPAPEELAGPREDEVTTVIPARPFLVGQLVGGL